MKNLNKKNTGFTLIEILVVIGIIAILASIVIIAINPKKHFDDAKQAQREANINTILNAIGQYIVDNKGNLPDFMDSANGSATNDIFVGSLAEINDDLCNVLVPEYVGAIPTDPDSELKGGTVVEDKCDDINPGDIEYKVEVLTEGTGSSEKLTGHVKVCAVKATTETCDIR